MTKTVGVAIITHNAKKHLPQCLPPFLTSALKPKVLVVNSSSNDGTVELAQEMGAEVLLIPRSLFNHGSTRERARLYLKTDIVVMVTPDAYPVGQQLLEKLVEPITREEAAVSYARQIPHDGACFFESFPRRFNYPEKSEMRSIFDLNKYGVYTFFCSDTCAAYSNAVLDEIGGFESALFGEDTVAVAKILRKGHKIAYVAEAVVKHSHKYTLKQEFKRHFDIGLSRKQCEHLFAGAGKDSQRGAAYVKELFREVASKKPHLLPYAFFQSLVKWGGYQIGRRSIHAPDWFKKMLSSQDFYWKNRKTNP